MPKDGYPKSPIKSGEIFPDGRRKKILYLLMQTKAASHRF
jgi:hypothetical protein